jgi:hypothetical protein
MSRREIFIVLLVFSRVPQAGVDLVLLPQVWGGERQECEEKRLSTHLRPGRVSPGRKRKTLLLR